MPHKKNANGRHHIPKMRHAVTNWAEYEGGLRRCGSLTLWIIDEAIAAWSASRRATPGGQATYSDSAIRRGSKAWRSGNLNAARNIRQVWIALSE